MTADPTLTPAEADAVIARRLAQITPLWLPERAAGYRIAVVYIATNEANSLLGMADRYQRAKDTVGYGRWLEPELHNRAYAGMPDAAHALELQGRVDDIYVVDRDGNVLYENHRADDGVMPPPYQARETILAERNRPPTPAEQQRFLATAVPLLDRGRRAGASGPGAGPDRDAGAERAAGRSAHRPGVRASPRPSTDGSAADHRLRHRGAVDDLHAAGAESARVPDGGRSGPSQDREPPTR